MAPCCSTCTRLLLLWLCLASVAASFVAPGRKLLDESMEEDPPVGSCYSGIAELRLASPDANSCIPAVAKTRPLTSPMDFSTDLPWDCLNELLVSVSGCKVSVISTMNTSSALPGFACNWIEYQGYVRSDNVVHMSLWARPITTTKWILYNTNLTTWRARGTETITFADLEKAITAISRRNPQQPLSTLLLQPEMMQLQADSVHFQQQLQQQQQPAGDAAAPGGRKLQHARLLQQQQQQQPTADTAAPGGHKLQRARSLQQQQQDPAAAPPAAKPALPPGVEADIGNGLVSEPIDWQKQLADVMQSNGSLLIGLPGSNTVILSNNERCNITYEVVSGGLLGVGQVDGSTVGIFAMPAIEPYSPPYLLGIDRQVLAAAAAASREAQATAGEHRALWISVVVGLCVLGAALLGSLVYLGVKLFNAPKAAAAAASSNGVHGIAMSPLEQQARTLGPDGGI